MKLEEIEEVHKILELGKHEKNLHHKKGFGGLLFIDLSMIKFSKLNRYIKNIEQENKQLKEKLDKNTEIYLNASKYGSEMEGKVVVLEYILEELKKWLEEKIQHNIPNARWKHYNEDGFNDYDMVNASAIKVQSVNVTLKEVLDKIKELEEGVKE